MGNKQPRLKRIKQIHNKPSQSTPISRKNSNEKLNSPSKVKVRTKERKTTLYVSKDLEITSQDFFTVLETIENGGNIGIQRFRELIKHPTLKELFETHGFPIKLTVPLIYSI